MQTTSAVHLLTIQSFTQEALAFSPEAALCSPPQASHLPHHPQPSLPSPRVLNSGSASFPVQCSPPPQAPQDAHTCSRQTAGSDTWWPRTSPRRSHPRWGSSWPHSPPCTAGILQRDLGVGVAAVRSWCTEALHPADGEDGRWLPVPALPANPTRQSRDKGCGGSLQWPGLTYHPHSSPTAPKPEEARAHWEVGR